MITLRTSDQRGRGEHGWLHARHTFSFAGYHDPAHMGFRSLRVINEDRVEAGGGFGMHSHHNMEILTHVVSGALAHKDSLGNGATLVPGMVQYMSAGAGIRHSEFNPSADAATHLLQIWLMPVRNGTPPAYADRDLREALGSGELVLVASPDGSEGSFATHADARVYLGRPRAGTEHRVALADGRGAWVQVVKGSVTVNGTRATAGDGVALEHEPAVNLIADTDAEVIVFDLG